MTVESFFSKIIEILTEVGIPHMVTGSFASTYHGVPRTTHDVDIVVELDQGSLERLLAKLPPDRYYVSAEAAHDALSRRSMFNVIDQESAWKLDIIVCKNRGFSRSEFNRRQPARILGTDAFVASAEDTILAKLEWALSSESERQLADVRGILEQQGSRLDRDYIQRWADDLGVAGLWQRVKVADVVQRIND